MGHELPHVLGVLRQECQRVHGATAAREEIDRMLAHVARFRAQLAARSGNADEGERLFKRAGGLFHELAVPFHLAVTRLEHGEWLASVAATKIADPLVAEARELFERLEANRWLERVRRGTVAVGAEAAPA